VKKKDIIEFEIGKMEFGGTTSTIVDDRTVKMKGGITGQKVKGFVQKIRKGKAEVKLQEVLEKSPLETSKVCPHFGECGGCSMLSVPYQKQLEIKESQIKELFSKHDFGDYDFQGIQGSPNEYFYRNKMEYTFGNEKKDGPLTLGLHKKGRHIDILTADNCMIVDKDFEKILKTTVEFFGKRQISHYRLNNHSGYLRNLVIRKGIKTGEIMINLVTTSNFEQNEGDVLETYISEQNEADVLEAYISEIKKINFEGNLVSLLHTINDGLADAVNCDELLILDGRDYIYEEILGLKFKISPFSFFQTNTNGAEKLYSIVKKFIEEKNILNSEERNTLKNEEKNSLNNKVIFDLYSGTGSIGQIVADKAKKVYGIEIVEEAVRVANENAKMNGLNNCKFIAGDVKEEVKNLNEKADLIIVDPPRPGIHKDAIKDICGFEASEIVYVSCNPKTMVEDLELFKEYGYMVKKVRCMDMFPSTAHVESVVLMSNVNLNK
jgi:23S rRNA (uracil-5-)-methyltransferase RumA